MGRALQTLLLLLVAAALATAEAASPPDAAGDACGSDCRSHSGPNLSACLRGIEPKGRAVFPEDDTYEYGRRTWNSRVLAHPAAIYYAHDTAGVAAACFCAHAWGVRVSPASGRQGLQGGAAQDGALLLDVSNMTEIAFSADNRTMRIGPGVTAVMVTAAVYDSGIPGAAVPSGGCPYVGAGGYYTSGGLGIPGRYLGLHCDSVLSLEAVLANGSVVEATAGGPHADLLWATCGGGGGTFAVITRFDLKVHTLPDEGRLTSVVITYAPGFEGLSTAWSNFQRWLPDADWRFDWTYGINKGRLSFTGLFLGPVAEALALLEAGGVLEQLDPGTPMSAELSDVADKYRFGLRLKAQEHYYFVHAEGTIFWTDVYAVPTPWEPFTPYYQLTKAQKQHLGRLMRGHGADRIVGGPAYSDWFNTQSRLVGLLPQEGVEALARYFADAADACAANASSAFCHAGFGGHVLGGAYANASADASAYPFRDKFFILNAMCSLPTPDAEAAPPEKLAETIECNNAFLRAMKPHLEQPEAGYVGYQLPSFERWQAGYWGGNYPRLQGIKARYDPLGVFSKPYTVQPAAVTAGNGNGSSDGSEETEECKDELRRRQR